MSKKNKSAKAEAQYANAPVAKTINRKEIEEKVNHLFSKETTAANGEDVVYFTNSKGANIELTSIAIQEYDFKVRYTCDMFFRVNVYNSDFTKKVSTLWVDDANMLGLTPLCKYLFERYGHKHKKWDDYIHVPDGCLMSVLMSIDMDWFMREMDKYPNLDDYEDWHNYDSCGWGIQYYDLTK